jgi:hypothetical protein
MPLITYSLRKLFKGDPKNIKELRAAQETKLASWIADGSFWLTLAAGDGQPVIVISQTGDASKKDYKKFAEPAKSFITGRMICDKKKKTVALTVDEGSKKALAEYQKDKNFSVRVWNLFLALEPNNLTVDGKPLQQRKLDDVSWVICSFDLMRLLTNSGKSSPLKAPYLVGQEVSEGKEKRFVTKGSLSLPAKIPIEVTIFGKMVEKAEEQAAIAAFLRDPIGDLMAQHAGALKDVILEIEQKIAPQDKDPKKAKTLKATTDAIAKFEKAFEEAVIKSVTEQWMVRIEAHVEYRDYKIDCTIKIVRGSVTVALGAVSAGVGGITGIGAILGLVGTLKGAVELGATIYTTFRSVDDLAKELNKTLVATLESYGQTAGWKDFGKEVLAKVPGIGPLAAVIGGRMGKSIKSQDQLKDDVKHYRGKVSGLLVKGEELGKKIEGALEQSRKMMAELDGKEMKAAESKDANLKKRNDIKRKLIGEQVTNLLDKVGDMFVSFKKGQENLKNYDEMLTILEGKVAENKAAAFLKRYFVPLLDLPWGVDPANLGATLHNSSSTFIDLASKALPDLVKMGEPDGEAVNWAKWVGDNSAWLSGIAQTLKAK